MGDRNGKIEKGRELLCINRCALVNDSTTNTDEEQRCWNRKNKYIYATVGQPAVLYSDPFLSFFSLFSPTCGSAFFTDRTSSLLGQMESAFLFVVEGFSVLVFRFMRFSFSSIARIFSAASLEDIRKRHKAGGMKWKGAKWGQKK